MARKMQNDMSLLCPRLTERLEEGFTRFEATEETQKLLPIYIEEIRKYDEYISSAQNDNVTGVLVATGLFSAIVAVFTLESYKKLSPDMSERSTALLEQISQQLAGSQNSPSPQASAPFSPTMAILWVNALWFLSLVMSITSAFYVMLVQQWARRYSQIIRDLSIDNESLQSFMFVCSQTRSISRAVRVAPLLIHISLFLFFSGLVVFLFTVSRTIATVVTICVGTLGLIYLIATIFYTVDDLCPFFTPMSEVWWVFWHASCSATAFCLSRITKWLCFNSPTNDADSEGQPHKRSKLADWSEFYRDKIKKHNRLLKDGLRWTIFQRVLDVPMPMGPRVLTRLLKMPAMVKRNKIEVFMASIPGNEVEKLITSPDPRGKTIFLERLCTLLNASAPDTCGHRDEIRTRRLMICLGTIDNALKATFLPDAGSQSQFVEKVWTDFGDIRLMQELWVKQDPIIRITARSISALLARHLIRKGPLDDLELVWLKIVMGKLSSMKTIPLNDRSLMDTINLDTFVYGALALQTEDLTFARATHFSKTLTILLGPDNKPTINKDKFAAHVVSLIERIKHDKDKDKDKDHDNVLQKLYQIFGCLLPASGDDQAHPAAPVVC
ncbi:hypothetical protein BC826DRAFT_395688 [Russula brevipes]|nr:hypothetical protein BC826DRAFT_395688 [Russula brevipes]